MLFNFNWLGNGVDYNSANVDVTFIGGSNITIVKIPVIMDDIVERSETFDLKITIPSSLKDQVIPGNITKAVGSIIDNTSKKIYKN